MEQLKDCVSVRNQPSDDLIVINLLLDALININQTYIIGIVLDLSFEGQWSRSKFDGGPRVLNLSTLNDCIETIYI